MISLFFLFSILDLFLNFLCDRVFVGNGAVGTESKEMKVVHKPLGEELNPEEIGFLVAFTCPQNYCI